MQWALPVLLGRLSALRCATAFIAVFMLSGCSSLFLIPMTEQSQSLLKPVRTSPESVTLEIFQLRLPASDVECAEELWQSTDELRLPVEVRNELIRNGFRAGVISGTLPDSFAKHLNLQSELPESSEERTITAARAHPKFTRRVKQLNRQDSTVIRAADLRQRVHVLVNEDSGTRGRSYDQVEAVYLLQAEQVPGQRARLELTPELQHGLLKNRYAGGDQGMFLMTQSRDRDTFDQLAMSVELAGGEMLVLGCLSDLPGSLGHAFHAQSIGGPAEYKVVVIRLLQVPGSEILASFEP